MRKRALVVLLSLPILAACVDDAASYQIAGPDHALTLIREQRWFWDKQAALSVTAARLPECQRRHPLQPANLDGFKLEVWQTGSNTFVLKQGKRLYLLETQTCEGFRQLDEEPPGGLGVNAGVFREEDGKLRFVAAPPPAPPALAPGAAPAPTPAN